MRRFIPAAGASALLVLSGCPAKAPASCQTLVSTINDVVSADGYVLRFVRSTAPAPGCEAVTPQEMSDIWVFSTVANGVVLAHSVAMPFPEGEPTPPGLLGSGTFAHPEVDADGFCDVPSLTTMSDASGGTVLSYEPRELRFLGEPAYQGAEFEAKVTVTIGTCIADYDVQGLSPAVACVGDADCDPFRTPLSSGIPSGLDQGCSSAPWTVKVRDYLCSIGVCSPGVCFLRQPFPSLKPGASPTSGSSPGG